MDKLRAVNRQLTVRIFQCVAGLIVFFGALWFLDGRDPFYLKACVVMSLCTIGVWGFTMVAGAMVRLTIRRRERWASQFASASDEELLDVLKDESDRDFARKQAAIQIASSRLDSNPEIRETITALQNHRDISVRGFATRAVSEPEERSR